MSARSILRRRREAEVAREVLGRLRRDQAFLRAVRQARLNSDLDDFYSKFEAEVMVRLRSPNPIFRDASA